MLKHPIQVLSETELLGHKFTVYGTVENPLFLAKEVAECIEYDQSSVNKLVNLVDDDEKVRNNLPTPGGNQQVWFLTEDGLYEVLMQSRKPIAKEIKKGVKEILKTIRKTGGYIATKQDDTPEEIMARALIVAQETIKRKEERLKQLEEKNAQLQPKAEFADCIMKSKDCITIGDLANILKQSCLFSKGKNALACWMRNNGYLLQKGIRRNMPTQKSMALGLMRVIETTSHAWNGTIIINKTVGITSLGQRHFIAQFRALLSSKESYEIEW